MLKAAMAGCGFLDSSIQSRKILLLLPFVSAGITISFTNRRMWICPLREGGGQAAPRDDGGVPEGGKTPVMAQQTQERMTLAALLLLGWLSRGPHTCGGLGEHPPPTTTTRGVWWVVRLK